MNKKLYFFLIFLASLAWSQDFTQAKEAYELAEKAITFEEREKHFNQALSIYLEHPLQHPHYFYNVGNCYYQLSKPGLALWYYEKALKEDPRNKKIQQNLAKAKEAVGLSASKSPTLLDPSWLLTHFLTSKEKNRVSLILLFGLTALASAFIWTQKKGLKILLMGSLAFTFCFFLSWTLEEKGYARLGLIVEPAFLRCDAAEHYELVDTNPILVGRKVLLLELSEDQKWAKVKLSSKEKGYLPLEKLRLL